MSAALDDYYSALQRLKSNRPVRVGKNTKITNDSVSLEAGRRKGSIKKSRVVYNDLIRYIKISAEEQKSIVSNDELKIAELERLIKQYRDLYEQSVAREMSLVLQIRDLTSSK